jgi:hypothetical protein
VSKQVFYTFGESDSTEPPGVECICNYGETIEEAIAANAEDKLDDKNDGGNDLAYWDTLKLFRITVEEIPRPPQMVTDGATAPTGGNAKS